MGVSAVYKRLQDAQRRLGMARESLRILDEQLAVWTDAFDDARLRSLMSETPLSDHELAEVRRHYEVAKREHERRSGEISELVRKRDELLREWTPEEVT